MAGDETSDGTLGDGVGNVAIITECGDSTISLSLFPARHIGETERYLANLVDIGFRSIEISVVQSWAATTEVSSMLLAVSALLAAKGGSLTLRNRGTEQIG